jgi:DNA-binding XRE family transcriptional regulator
MAGQKRSGLQQRFSPDRDLAHAGGVVVDLSQSKQLRRPVLQSEPTQVDSPRSDEFTEPDNSPKSARAEPERLWREVVGGQLRQIRIDRSERLTDVAERASVSPQYLSEIERGVKDPSSEVLAAVAGALGLTVAELTSRAYRLAPVVPLAAAPRHASSDRQSGPVCLAA